MFDPDRPIVISNPLDNELCGTPQFFLMTDEGLLIISFLSFGPMSWHLIAVVDPASVELLSLEVHAVDDSEDDAPYLIQATWKGEPVVYDPVNGHALAVTDPENYEAAVRVFPPVETSIAATKPEVRHD